MRAHFLQDPCDFFGETRPEDIMNGSPLWQDHGDFGPLDKDLWTVRCMLLGMTLGVCMLHVLFAFSMLAILLA